MVVEHGPPGLYAFGVFLGRLHQLGGREGLVTIVNQFSRQEGLVEAFPADRGRVLFAGAKGSRRHLIDALQADFRPLYRTILVRPESPPDGDLVVLASGSAARSFAALGLDVPAVSIGPQTTRAAEQGGLRVVAEAKTHDLDGLVEAVRLAACSSRS